MERPASAEIAETAEAKQARQRASVKWILSKAFNNRVPDNLRDPFYRDHDGQEHLKPQIVVGLGNATLYCQTLSNLYSDPNYQSLNHWSILQTLNRKGVPVGESADVPLTETVLIQTNPLRINAHMAVIEALMFLYAKEVASGDRVAGAVTRISGGVLARDATQNHESAMLCWVSHACAALKKRINQEIELGATDENGVRLQSPDIPIVHDYRDLCDGVCLAYLLSYYCPKVVPWTSVRVNYLPTVEDSIHNVLLVSNFSQKYLPYTVFHMTPEDITYMRGSMKQNLVVLLADLFNLFEIHPAKCVCFPGMDQQTVTRSPSQTTMRRHTPPKDIQQDMPAHVQQPAPVQQQMQPQQQQQQQQSGDDGFVVHRSRGVTTLSSMQEPLVPARLRQAKEKSNNDTKADERGDNHAAGRPSNWEDTRRPTYAGRRSRRNSTSDDSQLTIENFGGSQDQLHTIGRTVERERKISSTSVIVSEPAVAIRSTLADARGSIQIGYETDSGSEKQDRETEKTALRRQGSMDNVSLRNIIHSKEKDTTDGDATMAAAASPRNIAQAVSQQLQQQIQQMQLDSEEQPKRKTSFATLPNTTTWQQQSANSQQLDNSDSENRPIVDATKLSTIRLKLEEKRRHIEQEKKKMEFAMSRQQQKDLPDLNNLETKWDAQSVETKRTPDLDQMDMETYQQSIAAMNCSLQDIQQDIHRLASQQTHIQAHHLQAQQLMQAQQIANMLNQYGSQQNLPGQFARQVSQTSQPQPPPTNYGSTPQLSQLFNTTNTAQSPHTNNYSTLGRPPSRDPYLMQQPPQHTPPPQPQIFQQTLTPSSQHQQMQYLNEQGQYIPQPYAPSGYMTQRDNNQYVMGENGQSQSPYQQQQQYMSQQFTNQYIEQNHHQQPQYQSNQYLGRGAPPVDEIIYPDTYHRNVRDQHSPNQFYLHDTQQPQAPPTPPQPAQRRTWAQSASQHQQDMNTWSQSGSPKIDTRTWKSPNQNSGGFVLHQQNGNDYDNQEQSYQNLFPVHASPQHSRVQRQISQIIANDSCERPVRNKPMSPPADDMAPQSISFIGDEDSVDPLIQNTTKRDTQNYMQHLQQQDMEIHLGKLNITSGNRTYRIPSPTRPLLNPKSFQNPQHDEDAGNEKGFYISFDDQPKRPKPPLRAKRSPKKERSIDSMEKQDESSQEYDRDMDKDRYNNQDQRRVPAQENRSSMHEPMMNKMHMNDNQMPLDRRHLEDLTNHHQQNNQSSSTINDNRPREGKALIIGTELSNLDPSEVDEMEKKKERIMLLSLQRRQQQEEAKVRKEIQSMQQRDKEREKEEERIRKREEQVARRQAILEQYKLKKAIEEAEREGKTLDKADQLLLNRQQQQHGHHSAQPQAKMRAQKSMRPRPKTIHVETGSVDLSEASSLASRGKKGSSSNLTGVGSLSSHSMRRDYYRGSQDSLAIRESPDEYPSTSSTPIGRRGSYKTTRDTDSGLGRATPPRRAPSPGMGPSGRHLPSPSGPGSLPPGLMTKRRMFDDGSSDISSTPSSMMEYSGPKLYKQPATKSNRGIILNAVEYCVFPGVVNRDAKQKVLEKIARSEAKHFLVLFRDAGCQFRALYGYWPETETIVKLYGTGPSQVDELMFDKFFKYNSGGKCFSQVHTKHLTVTIDAFTIHNSLWQGKKVNYISKKDVPLVI